MKTPASGTRIRNNIHALRCYCGEMTQQLVDQVVRFGD